MAKFAYNNIKNISISHMVFKPNCGYYSRVLYKVDIDFQSKSKAPDKLWAKLRKLMIICWENLHHAQELQTQAHNKGVKPWSYAFGDNILLNSKYIKTKRNWKIKAKFFELF